MQITEQNAADFLNAKVRFEYGCMYGGECGWVVGHETNRWGTRLIVLTENGKQKHVTSFSNNAASAIGCHLLESEVA
tara:strand:+ start:1669 stop:1899 length:231 start_codon:yes stop_codon:yes gene_type:complete